MPEPQKIRRESIRWMMLLTLNNARPYSWHENRVLVVVRAEYPDATLAEIRRELDYLAARQLITIKRLPDGVWMSELTCMGVDVVEYTVDVDPGIARPEKYFDA